MQSQSVMEVGASSAVSGASVSSRRANASTTQSSASTVVDKVEISSSASYASSLVQQVKQMPATRSDIVASYKAQVESGLFPPPSLILGFQRLVGAQLAASKSDASGD